MKWISVARNLIFLFILFSSSTFAGLFDNAYQGNVLVEKQDESELKEIALAQVLVKVSGNTEVAQLDESKLLLKKSQSLLSQFGYQTYQGKRYFNALFDSTKVNAALAAMQQPVWGSTRPTTLIWLIKDGNSGRELLSDHFINNKNDRYLSTALQGSQQSRGITLQFPLMDLNDNLALNISDVSGRFYDPIATASSRYGINYFVAARLKQRTAEKWMLTWELVQFNLQSKQNKVLLSKTEKGEKSVVIATMVNQLADYYAGQFAILENQDDKFSQQIYVNGIDSLAKLTALNKLLTELYVVDTFKISAVNASQAVVDININGGVISFKNTLSAQSHLQPLLSNESEQLNFNWR